MHPCLPQQGCLSCFCPPRACVRGGGDRGVGDNVQGIELDDSAVVEQVGSVKEG